MTTAETESESLEVARAARNTRAQVAELHAREIRVHEEAAELHKKAADFFERGAAFDHAHGWDDLASRLEQLADEQREEPSPSKARRIEFEIFSPAIDELPLTAGGAVPTFRPLPSRPAPHE